MDIDPSQIGRNVPVEVAVVGDAKALLQRLAPMVTNTPRPDWMQYIENLKQNHPSLAIPASDTLQPQQVISALDTLVQEDPETIVVTGVGQHQMWAAQFLSFNHANTFVSSGGLGAMGFELPAALGAQVGKPGAPVWSVAGDGGFQMTQAELATASVHGLRVKCLIINNNYLGMVRQWQEMFYDNRLSGVDLEGNPDFVKLAVAYGVKAIRIRRPADVDRKLREALDYKDGPVVVVAEVVKEGNVFPMIPSGAPVSAMIIEKPKERLEKPTGST